MQHEYIYYPRIFMKIYGLKRQEIQNYYYYYYYYYYFILAYFAIFNINIFDNDLNVTIM